MSEGSRSESLEDMKPEQMTRRLPGQVMKDRVVGSADAPPASRVRRAASTRLRKLPHMPETPGQSPYDDLGRPVIVTT